MTPEAWDEVQGPIAQGAVCHLPHRVQGWRWGAQLHAEGAWDQAVVAAPWASALGAPQRVQIQAPIQLRLEGPCQEVAVDRIVLATGFGPGAPAPWLGNLADELDLPRAACGFPIVDPSLAWAPGLHLAGALGELELGPFARNLAGARLAAARLLEVA